MNWKTILEGAVILLLAGIIGWFGVTVINIKDTVSKNKMVLERLNGVEDDFQGLAFAIARAHPEMRVSQMLRSRELGDLSLSELQRALDLIHADSIGDAIVYLEESGIPLGTAEAIVGRPESL